MTDGVEATLPRGYDSVCTVSLTHTAIDICVNEAESRLLGDIESIFTEVVSNDGWDHDELDGSADSHPHTLPVDNDVSTPVANDALNLG